ncbi:preprotein translocase subunit SecF [Candidatus Pacearchaeota archaeon CG10_big_fil_rev_8_21_14_0_10_31_24]|nr:MAG: preprotein translocase subunit SecF [Candidatus Pacearchaeota archaeon CG10_big_fil_rev_8_21_14_0_10_31_24]
MENIDNSNHHRNNEAHHAIKNWYDRNYKILLIIPLIILVLAMVYLFNFYERTGDFIYKDSSLAGGTTITIQGNVDSKLLENGLMAEFADVHVREITELRSGIPVAVIVNSGSEPGPLTDKIEEILGYQLNQNNSSTEFTGSTLSDSFYRQLLTATIFSFILIAIVVFILFRTFIPSVAVIFSIFADIIISVAIVNLIGLQLSAAGVAAFLMLIGYSVDTDILLTSRVLRKKEGSVNNRIYGAFKTGMFMTITGLLAVLPAFVFVTGLPDSFRQIFLILGIGLFVDIVNTWMTNASIIKWYAVSRRIS